MSEGSTTRSAPSSGCRDSIDKNDIVIVVMGPTGTGRSSFVNIAAGEKKAMVGHGLRSTTSAVQPIRCPHPDGRRSIILVDTPGFENTHLSDIYTLKIIAQWLKDTYQRDIRISGLLYFHRISDVRIAGTPAKNLAMFRDLCGNDNLKDVVLVTTMWDEIEDQSIASRREQDLFSNFWKDMLNFGSRTCRFQGTPESAWEIINLILNMQRSNQVHTPLQIQQEMVDRGLDFHDTAAANTFHRSSVQHSPGQSSISRPKMRKGVPWTTGLRKLLNGTWCNGAHNSSSTVR